MNGIFARIFFNLVFLFFYTYITFNLTASFQHREMIVSREITNATFKCNEVDHEIVMKSNADFIFILPLNRNPMQTGGKVTMW